MILVCQTHGQGTELPEGGIPKSSPCDRASGAKTPECPESKTLALVGQERWDLRPKESIGRASFQVGLEGRALSQKRIILGL